ncbi:MAG: hypothetical protein HRT89_18080 [Lentisphaeria bacterium]|nr:hypothetical protein [Lentisphaeria bacterium]NQZ69966.1 hypothetical protein [Lentisphaeria bacterium]
MIALLPIVIFLVLGLGGLALFIVSIIMLVKTEHKGWLAGIIIPPLLLVIPVVLAFAMYFFKASAPAVATPTVVIEQMETELIEPPDPAPLDDKKSEPAKGDSKEESGTSDKQSTVPKGL